MKFDFSSSFSEGKKITSDGFPGVFHSERKTTNAASTVWLREIDSFQKEKQEMKPIME